MQAPKRLQRQEQHAHEVTDAQPRSQTKSSALQARISPRLAKRHAPNVMLAPTALRVHLSSPPALRTIIAQRARPLLSSIPAHLVKAQRQRRLQAQSKSTRVLVQRSAQETGSSSQDKRQPRIWAQLAHLSMVKGLWRLATRTRVEEQPTRSLARRLGLASAASALCAMMESQLHVLRDLSVGTLV